MGHSGTERKSMNRSGKKILRKSTGRRKNSRGFYNNSKTRPNSGIGMHSTRNKEVSNFATLASDILSNDNQDRKLRIAKPPQNLISVSNNHWNQITHNLSQRSRKTSRKVSRQNSQKDMTPHETEEYQSRMEDFTSSVIKDSNGISQPLIIQIIFKLKSLRRISQIPNIRLLASCQILVGRSWPILQSQVRFTSPPITKKGN